LNQQEASSSRTRAIVQVRFAELRLAEVGEHWSVVEDGSTDWFCASVRAHRDPLPAARRRTRACTAVDEPVWQVDLSCIELIGAGPCESGLSARRAFEASAI